MSQLPFGLASLNRGERMRVVPSPNFIGCDQPKPLAVDLKPVRYEELEKLIIPQDLRDLSGYEGYVLSVETARSCVSISSKGVYLNEDFRLVEDLD